MISPLFPIATLEECHLTEANALLKTWQHKMGPLNRGTGGGYSIPNCYVLLPAGEEENDELIHWWDGRSNFHRTLSVPVWHLHESLDRLRRLVDDYPRVALGSSGKYAKIRTPAWKRRMDQAFKAVCDDEGFPLGKLHGLRMLSPTVTSIYPFASADSTNIAQNIGKDQKWRGPYAPRSREDRALIMAGNIEHHPVAHRWVESHGLQHNFELLG